MPPEIISALGPTIGVVVVVGSFLTYMLKARASQDKIEDHRIEELKLIGQACHTHHEEMITQVIGTMVRVTDALDRNSQVLGQSIEALRRLNGK